MKIAVICCLHGNEPYGLEVIKKLPSHVTSFIGNIEALKLNKRFVDCDLNRNFPGNEFGNHEEKLANQLTEKLKYFDVVIDIHSSSNDCHLFGIITKPNKEKIELAKKMGLKRIVIMPENFASGKALIDFVKCGISLEIGPHNSLKNVGEIREVIFNFIEDRKTNEDLEVFEVIKIIKKQEKGEIIIKNFEEVHKGDVLIKSEKNQIAEFDFIPVLVNEEAYKDILCLACRKAGKDYF